MPATPTTHAISAADPPAITEEEWSALGEDEPGELVDGWLVEEGAPDVMHRWWPLGSPYLSAVGSCRVAV